MNILVEHKKELIDLSEIPHRKRGLRCRPSNTYTKTWQITLMKMKMKRMMLLT